MLGGNSVADPGFPEGGVRQPTVRPFFPPKNCMKMNKFWPRSGIPCAPQICQWVRSDLHMRPKFCWIVGYGAGGGEQSNSHRYHCEGILNPTSTVSRSFRFKNQDSLFSLTGRNFCKLINKFQSLALNIY